MQPCLRTLKRTSRDDNDQSTSLHRGRLSASETDVKHSVLEQPTYKAQRGTAMGNVFCCHAFNQRLIFRWLSASRGKNAFALDVKNRTLTIFSASSRPHRLPFLVACESCRRRTHMANTGSRNSKTASTTAGQMLDPFVLKVDSYLDCLACLNPLSPLSTLTNFLAVSLCCFFAVYSLQHTVLGTFISATLVLNTALTRQHVFPQSTGQLWEHSDVRSSTDVSNPAERASEEETEVEDQHKASRDQQEPHALAAISSLPPSHPPHPHVHHPHSRSNLCLLRGITSHLAHRRSTRVSLRH